MFESFITNALSTLKAYILMLSEPKPLISLIAVALLGAVLFVISKKTTFNARILAYGALSMAAAFALSYVKIFQFPNGGTITIASMLPLFIFAYIAGPWSGIAVGLCYSMLQFIQEPVAYHWAQFLLDYPLAFAMLGLAGFFRNNIYLGAIVGSTARFICHFLSGFIFFGSFAPAGQSVYLYSFIYNISYILPDLVICLIILLIPQVRSAISRIKSQSMFVNKGIMG
jgi:thiamine transporter